ncbi:hypothetical protein BH10BAC5_BH10BAC5_10990 [soil metagenome]
MNTVNNNDVLRKGNFFKTYKKLILSAALVIFITAGIGTFAFAKMHRFHEVGPLGFMIDKLTEGLDLSKDQKDQVDRLKATVKEKMDAEKNSKDKDNDADELINAFRNNNLDRTKLNDLEQKHSAKMQEMKDFTKDKIMEFYNILTPTQRTKVADKMSEMKIMMHEHMGKTHEKKVK